MNPTLEEIQFAIQYGPIPILSTKIVDRDELFHMYSEKLPKPEVNAVWKFKVPEEKADLEIDAIVGFHRRAKLPLWWQVGPDSVPADLGKRLLARNLNVEFEAMGFFIPTTEFSLRVSSAKIETIHEGNFNKYWAVFGKSESSDGTAWMLEVLRKKFGVVEIFVAYVDEKPVAAGAFRVMSKDSAFLMSGFVQPAYRGRGIYRDILNHRLQRLDELGIPFAVTLAKAETSAPICRRMGFREEGDYKMYGLGDGIAQKDL